MQLTLATKLVTVPLLTRRLPIRRRIAASDLEDSTNVWNVSLAGPAPPALPSLPIAPLTAVARPGDPDWQAASSSRIAAASRRTPSSMRSGVGAENDSRMKLRPLPFTKNASPAT